MENKKIGDSVFDENNNHLGMYVENLTDFEGTEAEIKKFKKSLLNAGALEIARNKSNELDRFEMYGYRKVFSEEFGTKEQLLVKAHDDLAWINVNMNSYTFEKIENKKNKPKRNRNRP